MVLVGSIPNVEHCEQLPAYNCLHVNKVKYVDLLSFCMYYEYHKWCSICELRHSQTGRVNTEVVSVLNKNNIPTKTVFAIPNGI